MADTKIPDVVRARIALHQAQAQHRAAQLDTDLLGRGVTTSSARQRRSARDAARREAEAWGILLEHITAPAPRCPVCGLIIEACTCTGTAP